MLPSLDAVQAAMMRAIDHGPDWLPDGLFLGSRDRIIAGMRVHANTISHARLVALEDSFPRTLALLGHELFNQHARSYLHPSRPGMAADAARHMLADIGAGFPAHLARSGETGMAAELARFEWAWLTAYHAADAPPMHLADLAGIAPDALMMLTIAPHPAAALDRFGADVHRLIGQDVPGLADAPALLLTRPDADILVAPADAVMFALFGALGTKTSIGNLLAVPCEPGGSMSVTPDEALAALIALIGAGALTGTQTGPATWPMRGTQ